MPGSRLVRIFVALSVIGWLPVEWLLRLVSKRNTDTLCLRTSDGHCRLANAVMRGFRS